MTTSLQTARSLARRAKDLSEKATPGIWFERLAYFPNLEHPDGKEYQTWAGQGPNHKQYGPAISDSEFIAASRTLVPELAAHVERLADALEAAQKKLDLIACPESDQFVDVEKVAEHREKYMLAKIIVEDTLLARDALDQITCILNGDAE